MTWEPVLDQHQRDRIRRTFGEVVHDRVVRAQLGLEELDKRLDQTGPHRSEPQLQPMFELIAQALALLHLLDGAARWPGLAVPPSRILAFQDLATQAIEDVNLAGARLSRWLRGD